MAAAIGARLPVNEPTGNMVVDIGGGTTEVAVISLGGIVTSQSIRIGGDELDEAIISFGKKEYSLMLGERTAEEIKMALGRRFRAPTSRMRRSAAGNLVSGLPKTVVISASEVRRAIEEPLNLVVDAVKTTLDKCPPELAGDVMDRGIALTGGGAAARARPACPRGDGHARSCGRQPAGLGGARDGEVRRGFRHAAPGPRARDPPLKQRGRRGCGAHEESHCTTPGECAWSSAFS